RLYDDATCLEQQRVELVLTNESLQHQTVELESAVDQLRDAEHALAERTREAEDAAQRHLTLLESIRDGFLAVDASWRATFVNRQFVALIGETIDDVLRRDVFERFPALRGSALARELRSVMLAGESATFVVPSLVNGRWLDVTTYPTPDGGLSLLA